MSSLLSQRLAAAKSTPESTYRPEGAKFQEDCLNIIVAKNAKGSEAYMKIGEYTTRVHHGADAEQMMNEWKQLSFTVKQ